MIRKFNYTGRQRIRRDSVKIEIVNGGTSQQSFICQVDLAGYGFPESAHVLLEAYHATEVKRFSLGSVSSITMPSDRSLFQFSSFPALHFRLLVVDETMKKSLILGTADRLSPSSGSANGHSAGGRSILPVKTDNSMNQEWRIEFDDGSPFLVLNGNVDGIRDMIQSDAGLRFSVLPAAFRQILMEFIFVQGVDDDPDEEMPWHDWLLFCSELQEETLDKVLDSQDDDFDRETVLSWIEEIVDIFASHNRFLEKLQIAQETD